MTPATSTMRRRRHAGANSPRRHLRKLPPLASVYRDRWPRPRSPYSTQVVTLGRAIRKNRVDDVSGATAPMVASTRRLLTLWELIVFGIILIQPIAPVPIFGVAQKLSDGHTASIMLIAMLAMVITAVSYGRMAALFPSVGSAYTYVGKGLNQNLGFL